MALPVPKSLSAATLLSIDFFGVKSSAQFINTLLNVIRRLGAMDKLISDSAASEASKRVHDVSKRVHDVLRHLMIEQWQSEAHMQHQNFAERHWQDLKRLTTWLMAYKNVPEDLWLLCLEYVANIMNITAIQSHNWQTPLQGLTGQTPNSSIAMVFEFYDYVYYRRDLKPVFPSQTVEKKGCFVGFSKDVGQDSH
jgi:quinol monooxygenase YgiN